MCGIAGLIHRDGATSVGKEMTAMLKSLQASRPGLHRLRRLRHVRPPTNMSCGFKLAEQEDMTKDSPHPRQDQAAPGRGRQTASPSSAPRPSRPPEPTAICLPLSLPLCRRHAAARRRDRADRGRRGSVLRQRARADQGSRRRDAGVGAIRARHLPRHACHRPYPHGDGVRCRYPLGPSLLGLSL